MLISAALLLTWIVALIFSVTLGGFIHLLPVVATPLLIAGWRTRGPPPSKDYLRWEVAHAKRPVRENRL